MLLLTVSIKSTKLEWQVLQIKHVKIKTIPILLSQRLTHGQEMCIWNLHKIIGIYISQQTYMMLHFSCLSFMAPSTVTQVMRKISITKWHRFSVTVFCKKYGLQDIEFDDVYSTTNI